MTTTHTQTADQVVIRAGDPSPTKPTIEEVIAGIVAEGHTPEAASELFEYMFAVVAEVRRSGRAFRPYDEHIRSIYETLDAVIPHGQSSTPGSGHDLLERNLLNAAGGELGIMHDRAHDGELVHCEVSITLNIQRT